VFFTDINIDKTLSLLVDFAGTLTEKSDVYAYGITLLELLSGRKPIDHSLPPQEQSLVNWVSSLSARFRYIPIRVDSHLPNETIDKIWLQCDLLSLVTFL
jgi:hypothetical protein